jgi:diguanylate cyclase (GGDEF)-like protein
VVLADIDDFKRINDRYGHEIGDEVILLASRTLRNSLRLPDLVGRWGGEEFLLVLPDAGLDAAVAERIRYAVERHRVRAAGSDLQATMTFGVTQRRSGESLDACLERADQALYEGKRQGKNRVHAYSPLKSGEDSPQLT